MNRLKYGFKTYFIVNIVSTDTVCIHKKRSSLASSWTTFSYIWIMFRTPIVTKFMSGN